MQVLKKEFFSTILQKNWEYMVYVPDGCNVLELPIFYLLHGASHPVDVWFDKGEIHKHISDAISKNLIAPAIIITPYSHFDGYSWYINQEQCLFETAFITEFMGYVENIYGGLRTKENRSIGGSSMGGYGSLRYSLIYPELFNSALLVAPAIWDNISKNTIPQHPFEIAFQAFKNIKWEDMLYINYIHEYLKKDQDVKFYISAGDQDSLGLEFFAAKLHKIFRENKINTTLRICAGDHGDWEYYPKAIIDGFKHLFPQT